MALTVLTDKVGASNLGDYLEFGGVRRYVLCLHVSNIKAVEIE